MGKIEYTEGQKERIRAMIDLFRAATLEVPAMVRLGCGVCAALSCAHVKHHGCFYSGALIDCKGLISRSLDGHAYLTDWQRARRYAVNGSAETRIAWVNQIIKDCEKAIK